MKITCRIRSDDGLTDICECPQFTNPTTGLGIAWACGQLRSYTIKSCFFTVNNATEKRAETHLVNVSGEKHSTFLRGLASREPESVTLTGTYQSYEISLTVMLKKRALQIFYPHSLEGKITEFESLIDRTINAHFALIRCLNTVDAGNKVIAEFSCPVFTHPKVGLYITSLCSYFPGSSLRWLAVYLNGIEKGNARYGDHTSRKQIPPKEFARTYDQHFPEKSTCALNWKGSQLTITCNYKTKQIFIIWDKKLSLEIKNFIDWLLPAMYDLFFGQH